MNCHIHSITNDFFCLVHSCFLFELKEEQIALVWFNELPELIHYEHMTMISNDVLPQNMLIRIRVKLRMK